MRVANPTSLCMLAAAFMTWSALAQEVIYEDYFETGETLSWSSSTADAIYALPDGGSLRIGDGSLEPGTTVEINPTPMPDLPDGAQGVGTAYEMTIDPPLRFPALLRLPADPTEALPDPWMLSSSSDDEVWQESSRAGDEIEGFIFHDSVGTTWALARVAEASVELESLTVEPSSVGVLEPVSAVVEWNNIAAELTLDFGDGDKTTIVPDPGDRNYTDQHSYTRPGRYVISVRLVAVPGTGQFDFEARRDVRVFRDPRGDWSSSFGDIDFDRSGGNLRGTFLPGENGLITGFLAGRTLEGFWVETSSARECDFNMLDSEDEPTKNWGKILFEFDENYTEFCGLWGYCGDSPTGEWKGWRGVAAPTCSSLRAAEAPMNH